MGLKISTNVPSLAARRNLGHVKRDQAKNLQRLSSGNRINSASDDAAGLAISEQLRAQIQSTHQAVRNANDGISFIQTAEGGLNEIGNILIRLKELSVQASSDTISNKERNFTNKEFQQLKNEIDRIAESTKFGNTNLLNGEGETLEFQVGISNVEDNDRISYESGKVNARTDKIGVEDLGVETKSESQESLEKIDEAINEISSSRAMLGSIQSRLESTVRNSEIEVENLTSANSRIRDADIAEETAHLAKSNVLERATLSVLGQANSSAFSALKLLS